MGREAQRSRRLHHQHRKVPAGAGAKRQGLQRALGRSVKALAIGELGVDGAGHLGQQRQDQGRPVPFQEPSHPAVDDPIGVGKAALHRAHQIRHVGRVVGERQAQGRGVDRFLALGRQRMGGVVQQHAAVEDQFGGLAIETGDGYAVAEYVVHMPHTGVGTDRELGEDDVLIVAFARPHHQTMLAEGHRLAVAVGSPVRDVKACHD